MESFVTAVNGFYPLTIFAKLFILDIYEGPGYSFVVFVVFCPDFIETDLLRAYPKEL